MKLYPFQGDFMSNEIVAYETDNSIKSSINGKTAK